MRKTQDLDTFYILLRHNIGQSISETGQYCGYLVPQHQMQDKNISGKVQRTGKSNQQKYKENTSFIELELSKFNGIACTQRYRNLNQMTLQMNKGRHSLSAFTFITLSTILQSAEIEDILEYHLSIHVTAFNVLHWTENAIWEPLKVSAENHEVMSREYVCDMQMVS